MNGTTDAVASTPVADTAVSGETRTEQARRKGPARPRLAEAGDIAADYREEPLDIADLDGDIDIDIENGRASVAIVADEKSTPALSRLVGPGGEVLEALQELTRLAVQAQTGDRTRLMLDVAGHRSTKRSSLVRLADEVVARVRERGTAERLQPMSAFERKVVHDAIAAAGLVSESEGEEPNRRVVVLPPSADQEGSD